MRLTDEALIAETAVMLSQSTNNRNSHHET